MKRWEMNSAPLLCLCLVLMSIQMTQSVDKELKVKAKTCLILYRLRQHQDPKTINAILSQLTSVENAKEKVSMYAITHCYSTITLEQVNEFQSNLQSGKSINSLDEANAKLLSLENIGSIDFDTFSDSIQEFFEVFNELMRESKEEARKREPKASEEPGEEEKSFYESNIFIIMMAIFGVNICFVFYQWHKVGKKRREQLKNNDNDKGDSKKKHAGEKSSKEEGTAPKDGKTTKVD